MYRLTKKIDYPEYANDYEITCDYNYQIVNKLGKLEDLEEEIGCPLEVVFKALKDGVYYFRPKVEKEIQKTNVELFFVEGGYGYDYGFKLKNNAKGFLFLLDYKKTWWLKEDKSE